MIKQLSKPKDTCHNGTKGSPQLMITLNAIFLLLSEKFVM